MPVVFGVASASSVRIYWPVYTFQIKIWCQQELASTPFSQKHNPLIVFDVFLVAQLFNTLTHSPLDTSQTYIFFSMSDTARSPLSEKANSSKFARGLALNSLMLVCERVHHRLTTYGPALANKSPFITI